MSRIASALAKRKALVIYLTVGYPSVSTTLEVVRDLVSWGCDIVELGIPFSDPMADGATIQKASYQALRGGVTTEICFDIASQLRREVAIPLIFMTYYNPVFSFGLRAFCQASAQAGIDGLIIPDLPPEESLDLEAYASEAGIDTIYLLSPTSNEERINLVAHRSRGFIYVVSVTGVTGTRKDLPEDLEGFVARVRAKTSSPLCVGFGISTPEQAKRVARIADGVIVGSRLIQLLEENAPADLSQFITGLRNALDTS